VLEREGVVLLDGVYDLLGVLLEGDVLDGLVLLEGVVDLEGV
jgi:hypothetical protein